MTNPQSAQRINKYLADHFPLTRRKADELIAGGGVKINGKQAVLGALVKPGDQVEVKTGKPVGNYQYFAYHKPVRLPTHATVPKEPSAASSVRLPVKAFPIGRLDKDSRGLLIFSDDGRLADALLNPKKKHEKEYVVTVDKSILPDALKRLALGLNIEGYHTKKAKTWKSADKEFHIILTEGKKHQIRRMCAAVSLQVKDLLRVRIENIELGDLPAGQFRTITGEELTTFKSLLGL
ncbi:MAG: hypothetical protein A2589_03640 [Candidatus Vogelbacteria bacterium RIFOXYD1_FULL_46_19]|uniref:Pseudouridine synthase n=1 Tax=Candidatus Vogelbacteria bacterium RIFOXYD1_FULL_46_19 TaxID=1802439 RepID=A0A1G2QHM0_9BACT|nr:MAG: hypothetical protein A2589_03640 [Candidatus Vogelbacteria bacterium RIFOXYD1_FULL_46_19]